MSATTTTTATPAPDATARRAARFARQHATPEPFVTDDGFEFVWEGDTPVCVG